MPLDWNQVEQSAEAEETAARRPRPGFRFCHRLQVRFRDCDAMRHVNNAVYFTYCEQARFAYWRHVARVDEASARSFIIARCACDYDSPALPGEWLDIWVRVESIGRTSFPMGYEIASAADGRLIATAQTVQVMFDYGVGRPFAVPEELVALIEAFEGRSLRRSDGAKEGA